jgi:AcrR family transcriptional regulator
MAQEVTRDGNHTANRIEEAALHLFFERGYKATTMREIGEASGLTAGDDPKAQLRAYVHQHALLHTQLREEAGVANQEIYSLPDAEQGEIVESRRRLRGLLVDILKRGVDQGVFDVPNVSVVSNSILTMLIRIADWFRPDGPLSAQDVSDLHAELALRMVKAG